MKARHAVAMGIVGLVAVAGVWMLRRSPGVPGRATGDAFGAVLNVAFALICLAVVGAVAYFALALVRPRRSAGPPSSAPDVPRPGGSGGGYSGEVAQAAAAVWSTQAGPPPAQAAGPEGGGGPDAEATDGAGGTGDGAGDGGLDAGGAGSSGGGGWGV